MYNRGLKFDNNMLLWLIVRSFIDMPWMSGDSGEGSPQSNRHNLFLAS